MQKILVKFCHCNKAFLPHEYVAKFLYRFIWPCSCNFLSIVVLFHSQRKYRKLLEIGPILSISQNARVFKHLDLSLSRYALISWRLTSLMPVNIFQISLAMWLILTSGDDDSPDQCFVSDKKSSSEVEASPPLSPSTPFIRSYTGPNKTSSTLSSGSLDNKEAPSKLL